LKKSSLFIQVLNMNFGTFKAMWLPGLLSYCIERHVCWLQSVGIIAICSEKAPFITGSTPLV
jgi:hypothetical protein